MSRARMGVRDCYDTLCATVAEICQLLPFTGFQPLNQNCVLAQSPSRVSVLNRPLKQHQSFG